VNSVPVYTDVFLHVRVVMGIVVGLSIARLLNGAAYFLQHPGRRPASPIHLGWAGTLLLSLVHFWWWELQLASLPSWRFQTYLFLTAYTVVLFLLCSLLFPDEISEYGTYEQFFLARRRWFFGLLAVSFLFDFADTLLKGWQHLQELGRVYEAGLVVQSALCVVAMITPNRRFHLAFAAAALVYQLSITVQLLGSSG
jgi:hypothetical protein